MIDYAIPYHPDSHIEMPVLRAAQTTAPELALKQFENEFTVTAQTGLVAKLSDTILNNRATYVPTSQKSLLKRLLQEQMDLAKERGNILSLPFLWIRFDQKRRLKEIESVLDHLEMKILDQQENSDILIANTELFIADIQKKIDFYMLSKSNTC